MNIKTKLTIAIAVLVAMIVLVVALSITNLQILTATEPNSPAAGPGLNRALIWVSLTGGICIVIGLTILIKLPDSITRPIQELSDNLLEIANHNYNVSLNLNGSRELEAMSKAFNRMANRLNDYHNSTLADLKTSKRYMETIINAINEPIIGLDMESNILFINDEALKVLNLDRAATEGRTAQDIALRNDLLRKLLCGLGDQKEQPFKNDNRHPLKIYADNKECYFQVKYMNISMKGCDGEKMEQRGNVILLKNITEFKELDTAKTTFISTISHELKTPISAILMSLQLLEDKRIGQLNPEQEELSESIKENSERLLNITGELLNITQVESGKLQLKPKITKPIELIEYALKATRIQAEKFGIQLEVEYPDDNRIKKLFVDSEKIAWVLTNLVNNAVRYSAEQGRVVVGARQQDDTHVELFVQDFGKGIDPRYHESIFEPYFRVPGTKVQGSGLGLSISRDFVEAHGGRLRLESEIGKGCRFIISLPV